MSRLPDGEREILNEMRRDAAPTPEEARAEHRRILEREGCAADGCDVHDADALEHTPSLMPRCPLYSPGPGSVLCDTHVSERPDDYRAKRLLEYEAMDADDRPDMLVRYDCGAFSPVETEHPTVTYKKQSGWDDDGEPIYEEVTREDTREPPRAEFNAECACGAGVAEVFDLSVVSLLEETPR